MSTTARQPIGSVCLVLHSHLPWLAHHGRWPVGEEWLHQAWAASYLPVLDVVARLAEEGRRGLLSLGVTPVLAAQLDDPHCLREFHSWLGNWQLRAQYAAGRWRQDDPALREVAAAEYRRSAWALDTFESRWRHGASPVLDRLRSAGALEVLGGPATHPFQPLLGQRFRRHALRVGLADGRRRLGGRLGGIWAPECGYAPGMEADYAAEGVTHVVVEGAALPDLAEDGTPVRLLGDSPVVAFARDTELSLRVWSHDGYPGHADYRDFHTFDHPSGLKPARVTGRDVAPGDKLPYDPARALHRVSTHVDDFVTSVRDRLVRQARATGRPATLVAAFDTELFGHWWHEGPQWLEGVLRTLPEAGVRVRTLGEVVAEDEPGTAIQPPPCSWGVGRDWRVWNGDQVAELVATNRDVERRLVDLTGRCRSPYRDPVLDQLDREALLTVSSDWAFMVTGDSAADYALHRAREHAGRFRQLADLVERGDRAGAARLAQRLRGHDGLFGHLDARDLGLPDRLPGPRPGAVAPSVAATAN
ncbi:1,4-alpha-glucan branching protein domain-containing protein [Actinoalloteichus spitiensis]|uniref:1,4-alpha-glucan branching protein domain-containing protein n=1 Tax=Actinoalloteichus spitiensis TaxID=252394 RepID=UPI0012F65F99|nr:glycoside hydrolase family 57 protein [Actinoalloteichus spitiensis]